MNAIHTELVKELGRAFAYRKNLNLLDHTETIRLFYGPGESDSPSLNTLAIDLFQEHAWITAWKPLKPETQKSIIQFLRLLSPWGTPIQSIVLMNRSEKSVETDVETLWGNPPSSRFSVQEFGIPYLIQFQNTKHPGLFLDHAPLRKWLSETQHEKRVLNLFSYTGSLSIAAAKGGASHVTTLDLSKPTLDWAKESWINAGVNEKMGDFIFGDVFEWLPRLKKKNESYDTIICDPPSFSRSKNGTFSTQKDSVKLHKLIFELLTVGGTLITSINSENISESAFLKDVHTAAEASKIKIRLLRKVDLPESFPTSSARLNERYLKGAIFLRQE